MYENYEPPQGINIDGEKEVQKPESYEEQRQRLAVEQAGMSKEQIMSIQGGMDLDAIPELARARNEHRWVKRGIKMSCEGGNHPHHSHFLVSR